MASKILFKSRFYFHWFSLPTPIPPHTFLKIFMFVCWKHKRPLYKHRAFVVALVHCYLFLNLAAYIVCNILLSDNWKVSSLDVTGNLYCPEGIVSCGEGGKQPKWSVKEHAPRVRTALQTFYGFGYLKPQLTTDEHST